MFITFELDRDELARKKISMNIAICKNREDFSGFSYCEKYLSFSEFTSINKKELLVLNGLLVFFLRFANIRMLQVKLQARKKSFMFTKMLKFYICLQII